MNMVLRMAVTITLVIGIFAGVSFARPQFLADMGMDFWSFPKLNQKLNQETERSGLLDDEKERLVRRCEANQLVVQKLIDGTIQLPDAVETIRSTNSQKFLSRAMRWLNVRGKTETEQLHQLMIYWVEKTVDPNSVHGQQVFNRINAQLKQLQFVGKQQVSLLIN